MSQLAVAVPTLSAVPLLHPIAVATATKTTAAAPVQVRGALPLQATNAAVVLGQHASSLATGDMVTATVGRVRAPYPG